MKQTHGVQGRNVPVCAIIGKEPLLTREALLEFLAAEAEIDSFGPSRYDGTAADLAAVLDDLRTPSLLGGRRIVIVDDAEAFISAHREALEAYCQTPATSGCLILLCSSLPRNTRLYRSIDRVGLIRVCEAPRGRQVTPWLTRRATERYGKRLTQAAAVRLVERLGDAVGVLDSELGKLASYVAQRPTIEPGDVDSLTGHLREEKIFAVTDAMLDGETAAALTGWRQVLATDRAAPGRALAGMAWGIRRLLEARQDLDRGVSPSEIARRFYQDASAVQRRLSQISADGLSRQLDDLLEADIAIKTGLSDLDSAMERLIVKHATEAHTAERRRGKAASRMR